MAQITQQDFISRADEVTNEHLRFARQATADLNSIMTGLRQITKVEVPAIDPLDPVEEPDPTTMPPSEDVVAVFHDDYQGVFGELKTWFESLKENAIATFFPFIDTPAAADADAWMQRAIAGTAITLAEDAELNRGRSRAYDESMRTKRTVAGASSAAGYILPTGAMLWAQYEADFAAGRTVAETNRDIIIKAQEVRIQQAQFAVQQVNNLRSVAAQSLNGYLNAFASLPNSAISYAAQKENAQKDLWEAGRQYYAARLGYQSLLTDIAKTNQQSTLATTRLQVEIDDKMIERDLKSLQVMADVMGRLVAGAMAGINSHISLSAASNANDNYNHNLTS